MRPLARWIPASLVLVAAATWGADPKLMESCNACHGEKGVSAAQDVPTLAGVSAPVQAAALKSFKARSRPCIKVSYKRGETGRQDDMCSVAAKLGDADITALTESYARLPYSHVKQSVDASKAAAGKAVAAKYCEGCHSKGGSDPSDDAGILAGQPVDWLKSTLTAYKSGQIPQQKMMKDKLSKLSDADVDALAQYYGSL